MDQAQVSPQTSIFQLGLGFVHTIVLRSLVKTGVIEQLRDGPRRLTDLAQACNLNSDVLYRTLRFAAVIGVVTQAGETYSLTEMGRLLLKDVPGSLYTGLMMIGSEPWQKAWNNFEHTLTNGENAFEPVMGSSFFDFLDRRPEYGEPFNQWQSILTSMAARAITEAYDFSSVGTLCDIGGGQGILLKSILTANPLLKGILYDQENVVKEHVLTDLAQRVEVQSGNFFERVPAADVLLMKNILHDWSDEKCQVILGQCRRVMHPATRLLVIEMVIASPTDFMGAFYDLHMQVLMGGKERTEVEFRSLLQQAGMRLDRILVTKSPIKIIEASLL